MRRLRDGGAASGGGASATAPWSECGGARTLRLRLQLGAGAPSGHRLLRGRTRACARGREVVPFSRGWPPEYAWACLWGAPVGVAVDDFGAELANLLPAAARQNCASPTWGRGRLTRFPVAAGSAARRVRVRALPVHCHCHIYKQSYASERKVLLVTSPRVWTWLLARAPRAE